ncbi:MAG: hypothetical protein ACR2OZ_19040 [Verrucomicrobiales bacterium]
MWPEAPPDTSVPALTADAVASLDPLPAQISGDEATPFDLPEKPANSSPRPANPMQPFQPATSRSVAPGTSSGLSKSVFDDIGRELQQFGVPLPEKPAEPARPSAVFAGSLTPDEIWEMAAQLGSPPSPTPLAVPAVPKKPGVSGRTAVSSDAAAGDFLLTPVSPRPLQHKLPANPPIPQTTPTPATLRPPVAPGNLVTPQKWSPFDDSARARVLPQPPATPPASGKIDSAFPGERQSTGPLITPESKSSEVQTPVSNPVKPISASVLAEIAERRAGEAPPPAAKEQQEPFAIPGASFARLSNRPSGKISRGLSTGATAPVDPAGGTIPPLATPAVPIAKPPSVGATAALLGEQSRPPKLGPLKPEITAASLPAQPAARAPTPVSATAPINVPLGTPIAVERQRSSTRRKSWAWLWVVLLLLLAGGLGAAGYYFRRDLPSLFTPQFWERIFSAAQAAIPTSKRAEEINTRMRAPEAVRPQPTATEAQSEANTASASVISNSPTTTPNPAHEPSIHQSPTAVVGAGINVPRLDATVPSEKVGTDETTPIAAQGATGESLAPPGVVPEEGVTGSPLLASRGFSLTETSSLTSERTTTALSEKSKLASDPELAKAQSAVQSLVSATNVDAILPFIFDGDRLRGGLLNYYSSRPLQPLTGSVIEVQFSGKVPTSGARAFIFSVVHPDHPRGFPVSAEATPNGYQVDWESYIQWRDEWLRGFLENRPAGPYTLFVVLQRSHYFNDDVPSATDKHCFKITSAVPGDPGTNAFAEKRSPVGKSLAESYDWGKAYFPVVELEWIEETTGSAYVRLNRVVRATWRRNISR